MNVLEMVYTLQHSSGRCAELDGYSNDQKLRVVERISQLLEKEASDTHKLSLLKIVAKVFSLETCLKDKLKSLVGRVEEYE